MAEQAVRIQSIDKLTVKNFKREVKEEGDVIDVQVVTQVSFEAINVDTRKLGKLIAMIQGPGVDVFVGSPQAVMALEEEPETALAR
jgi:hypothetical protein